MLRSDPIAVIVDTREQEPYAFTSERIATVRRALAAGDYSLEGHETAVAVERKSLDDYVGSVIFDRERFLRELDVLAHYDVACVVVEATLEDIVTHRYRSGAHPNAVIGATMAIIVDYGVPVFFCSDRQLARRFVEDLLLRFHRKAAET
jgi:DNA excision repair protein ERCC-4